MNTTKTLYHVRYNIQGTHYEYAEYYDEGEVIALVTELLRDNLTYLELKAEEE